MMKYDDLLEEEKRKYNGERWKRGNFHCIWGGIYNFFCLKGVGQKYPIFGKYKPLNPLTH